MTAPSLRVLVIDDEPPIRKLLRMGLSTQGHDILEAPNGKRGLELLDQNLPVADEPTIGTMVGDNFVYVANSQWEDYDDKGVKLPNAVLRRPVLLYVPVRR